MNYQILDQLEKGIFECFLNGLPTCYMLTFGPDMPTGALESPKPTMAGAAWASASVTGPVLRCLAVYQKFVVNALNC